MFSEYYRSAILQIDVLERFLHVYEEPRNLDAKFSTISHAGVPDVLGQERIFRHCSVVTRLYSIYENMTMSCVHHWLSLIPRFKHYHDISDQFQSAYHDGLPKIISQSNSRKYRHLKTTQELKKYLNAIEGIEPWEFIAEAITHQSSNMRLSNLMSLLGLVAENDFNSFLKSNQKFNNVIQSMDTSKSVDAWIDDAVTYRNDAAHGTPDDIMGLAQLKEHIILYKSICTLIVDFLKYNTCSELTSSIDFLPLGKVTEKFSKNVRICTFDRITIDVGQTLCFFKHNYYAEAKIESIQLLGDDIDELRITASDTEVGLTLSDDIALGTSIIVGIESI